MTRVARTPEQREAFFSLLFYAGMWWRVLYGSCKFAFGILLLQEIGHPVSQVLLVFTNYEITKEFALFLIDSVGPLLDQHHVVVTHFLAIYMLFWGFIEVALSLAILRRILWAFPASLVMIAIFVLYEIFRIFHTHSLLLGYIIVVDIALYWLIRREYRKLQSSAHIVVDSR